VNEFQTANLGMTLLVASVVAIGTRRIRLPYSVGLVFAGVLLAMLPIHIAQPVSAERIYTMLLPALIFEAALQIRWSPFRRELPVVLTLVFLGVPIAAAVVAAGMHFLLGWSWIGALLFGSLIAATDPVSVIAAFREMRVEARLSLLVETESLLNDGAAAVGFAVLVIIAGGASLDPLAVTGLAAREVFGAIIIGAAVAGALLLLSGRTEDHLVEITLTTIAAYASFLLAEQFDASGVLASVTAGMIVGNIGWRGAISESGRSHVLAFWAYAAFLANSIIFISIGLYEAGQGLGLFSVTTATAILLVLLSRVATVYLICAGFRRSGLSVDWRFQHVLVWGGLRGALGLALALTVPASVQERGSIIVAAFAVVAFSIFVQGTTMSLLVRRLKIRRGEEA
jgi:monovalent cation:H+ antiporter, CPA1 family